MSTSPARGSRSPVSAIPNDSVSSAPRPISLSSMPASIGKYSSTSKPWPDALSAVISSRRYSGLFLNTLATAFFLSSDKPSVGDSPTDNGEDVGVGLYAATSGDTSLCSSGRASRLCRPAKAAEEVSPGAGPLRPAKAADDVRPEAGSLPCVVISGTALAVKISSGLFCSCASRAMACLRATKRASSPRPALGLGLLRC